MIKIFCIIFPVASDINEFSRLILESLQGMLQMEEWLKIINDQLPRLERQGKGISIVYNLIYCQCEKAGRVVKGEAISLRQWLFVIKYVIM